MLPPSCSPAHLAVQVGELWQLLQHCGPEVRQEAHGVASQGHCPQLGQLLELLQDTWEVGDVIVREVQ
jgi:hypothetical protein